MDYALQQLLNALAFGAEYSLVALGLAVVFSIMGLVNFAHGEIIGVSAYSVFLAAALGLTSPIVAVLIAVTAAALAAVTFERVAFRPVRYAPTTTGLLTAFGVSIVVQNLFMLLISPKPQSKQPCWPCGRRRLKRSMQPPSCPMSRGCETRRFAR